uniref:Uncharacterized protein n=1 Tax=Anguilla anguilla TaxID=7936 RepID=A0A0E9PXF7_ANGAN
MFFLTVKVQMSNSCSKNRWEWQIKAYIQHKVHNFVTRTVVHLQCSCLEVG